MTALHGHTSRLKGPSATYRSWQAMKGRCDYPSNVRYPDYGGRGITYQKNWADFSRFLSDMGPRPEGTTLDRIDTNGNYCKENCRWASRWQQDITKRPRKSNLSCKAGVSYKKGINRWVARIGVKGREVYLGCFLTEEEAITVRCAAECAYEELGV